MWLPWVRLTLPQFHCKKCISCPKTVYLMYSWKDVRKWLGLLFMLRPKIFLGVGRWSSLSYFEYMVLIILTSNLLILLNIMFHALMGRFQLELFYYFTYFSTVVPSNICVFLSPKPFVVNTTFSTGFMGVKVTSISWLGKLTVGV